MKNKKEKKKDNHNRSVIMKILTFLSYLSIAQRVLLLKNKCNHVMVVDLAFSFHIESS